MHHGQELPLPGLEIILKMGVPGEPHMTGTVGADLCGNAGVELLGTGESQRPIHKIILIINDEQKAIHRSSSFF